MPGYRAERKRHVLATACCGRADACFWAQVANVGLQAFVREVVRRRVGKYMEAKHPARLVLSEATQVYSKVVREVIGKEQQVRWDTGAHPLSSCMFGDVAQCVNHITTGLAATAGLDT